MRMDCPLETTSSQFKIVRILNCSILRYSSDYPVSKFNGDKGFVISTTSWAGGEKFEFVNITNSLKIDRQSL